MTDDDKLVEALAWAIAGAIAERHGSVHTAEDWMNEPRREEARACLPIIHALTPKANSDALLERARDFLLDTQGTGSVGHDLGREIAAALKGERP